VEDALGVVATGPLIAQAAMSAPSAAGSTPRTIIDPCP
jgi:hypothetical protein